MNPINVFFALAAVLVVLLAVYIAADGGQGFNFGSSQPQTTVIYQSAAPTEVNRSTPALQTPPSEMVQPPVILPSFAGQQMAAMQERMNAMQERIRARQAMMPPMIPSSMGSDNRNWNASTTAPPTTQPAIH